MSDILNRAFPSVECIPEDVAQVAERILGDLWVIFATLETHDARLGKIRQTHVAEPFTTTEGELSKVGIEYGHTRDFILKVDMVGCVLRGEITELELAQMAQQEQIKQWLVTPQPVLQLT